VTPSRATRRLQDIQRRIAVARDEIKVLDEQLAVWTDAFEDARLRSLMSETPQADHELADVRRHYDVARRERERREVELRAMVEERDKMLREWTPEEVP
jgi:chromosome segregation ATPase